MSPVVPFGQEWIEIEKKKFGIELSDGKNLRTIIFHAESQFLQSLFEKVLNRLDFFITKFLAYTH